MQTVFPELIAVDVEAKNSEDAIRKIGQLFYDNGFVKDTYIDAVVVRESKFPTGLQLDGIAVAMPNTDPPHVRKSGVCVAKLAHPVPFIHMGEEERTVEAELIFMMAILSPDEHMDTLQKVLKVFQNAEIAKEFKNAKDTDELYKTAMKYIGE